jgi:NH3-dependent NAD+ synthetase
MNIDKTIASLLAWLQTAKPAGNGLLIPISGGSDSALCFWLCNQIFKDDTKGIFIGTNLRQKEWFQVQGTVQLDDVEIGGKNPEVQRWAHFLNVSLQENRVLTGSRNFTESTLGTFSNASRLAALLPLGGLWKHQVMELCDYVGVPSEITDSSRRADPECGRPEKMADIPFEVVDTFLAARIGGTQESDLVKVTPEQYDYLEKVYTQNSYKIKLPSIGPEAVETR